MCGLKWVFVVLWSPKTSCIRGQINASCSLLNCCYAQLYWKLFLNSVKNWEQEPLSILCQNTDPWWWWKKKAQFWLFTGVAFEVFFACRWRTLGRLKAVKVTSDAGNVCPDSGCHLVREALVLREQVGRGNQWKQKGKDHSGPHSSCHASETGIH